MFSIFRLLRPIYLVMPVDSSGIILTALSKNSLSIVHTRPSSATMADSSLLADSVPGISPNIVPALIMSSIISLPWGFSLVIFTAPFLSMYIFRSAVP